MAAIPGSLMANLATPAEFEAAAGLVNEDAVAAKIVCGPDPDRHLAQIHSFIEAGYDHVYVHQVGRHQDGFFSFYEREIIPRCTV